MSLLDAIPGVGTAKLVLWGVAGGAVLVAAGIAAYYWHDYNVTKANLVTAHEEVVEKKAEVKNLTDTVEHQEAAASVNEATQTNVAQEKKDLTKTSIKIDTTHQAAVQQIEKKYDALPQTDANAKAKEDEISADRLRRLWEVYCIPNADKDCAAIAAKSASAVN